MVDIHALPAELWELIFGFLLDEDLKILLSVNRAFRMYASPVIWRRLTICSLIPGHIEKAKAILKNPDLARHVTVLRLRPSYWLPDEKGQAWTNLWMISAFCFWDVLKYFVWRHPILSWQFYRRSVESVEISTKVVFLLTHVQEVSVIPLLHQVRQGDPSPEPYRKIWAGLRTEHLQRLNLRFLTTTAIQTFSTAMKSTPSVVFTSLQTILLDLGFAPKVYPELLDDLRTVLDCGRATVRCFGITCDLVMQDYFVALVGSFGIFPNLVQFHFELFSFRADRLGDRLYPFLLNHRSTLRKVHLSTFPFSNSIIRSLFGSPSEDGVASLQLEALTLGYQFELSPIGPIVTLPPKFQRFADTLTSLMLLSKKDDCGLTYEDVRTILRSLRQPDRNIGLKRLWIYVRYLSPQLLDYMARTLKNLESLDLRYWAIVADDEEKQENKDLFFQNIRSRSYPHWALRFIDVKLWNHEQNEIPADLLMRVIPSLKRVGPIDWSDVELSFGPW